MVNLALSHSGGKTLVKAIFFSKTVGGLGLTIDDIYTLSSPSVTMK